MAHIAALIGIGLICGLLIYIVFIKVPQKVKGLEKTEEISAILPGANCGACGHPGCFAYARALSQDPDLMTRTPCSMMLSDADRLRQMEKALGVTLDSSQLSKKAVVRCSGGSEIICEYSGALTCKAVSQLLRGYKRCPYACLALGDCAKACPQGAVSVDPEQHVAIVDYEKCTGCGLCVAECPQGTIELVPATTHIALLCNYQSLRDIPGREKCDFGCVHCRKCFKACEHEAIQWNKERAVPDIVREKCTLCLKCVEACEHHRLVDLARAREPKEDLVAA